MKSLMFLLGLTTLFLLMGCDSGSNPADLVGPQIKYAQHDEEQGTVDVETGTVRIWEICYEDCGPLLCLDCRMGLCEPPPRDCEDLLHRIRLQHGLE